MNIENNYDEKLFEDYYIDEAKFLLVINEGETFTTAHRSVSSCKKGGTVYFKQELSYKFDTEFIKTNEKKLKQLGILCKKKMAK